ncbi:Serine/threonine-protein kinase mTOR [Exaiptasia diaphana]|nr:Serine/threonine-protein kinase mTOR [Exaiptasia diaphana]
MTREKFPEKIPFRLTRMLTNAMEVTGIDGNYRLTCESVMRTLREHKDSVMAVLEAFVYDPLLNWRLMDSAAPKIKRSKGRSDTMTEAVGEDILEGVDVSRDKPTNKKADHLHSIGRDFAKRNTLEVPSQVELLIKQAVSHENLCQCYIGWTLSLHPDISDITNSKDVAMAVGTTETITTTRATAALETTAAASTRCSCTVVVFICCCCQF